MFETRFELDYLQRAKLKCFCKASIFDVSNGIVFCLMIFGDSTFFVEATGLTVLRWIFTGARASSAKPLIMLFLASRDSDRRAQSF